MKDEKEFKWHTPPLQQADVVRSGDIRIITVPVKVIFEWSDKIVADHDYPESDWVEYKEGYIMKVLPQTIVYNGEPTIFMAQAMIEK